MVIILGVIPLKPKTALLVGRIAVVWAIISTAEPIQHGEIYWELILMFIPVKIPIFVVTGLKLAGKLAIAVMALVVLGNAV
jgi:hypothetical protein